MSETYRRIFDVHSNYLTFDNKISDARIIAFSAVPGSGKSELTKQLSTEYGYVRIANKEIRSTITALDLADKVAVGDYTLWLLNKITEVQPYNIVFDRNIDQWYEPLKLWADQHNYRLIIVGLDVSRTILDKRLQKREKSSDADVFKVTDFYDEQHKAMYEHINRDIIFRDNYDLDEAARLIAHL